MSGFSWLLSSKSNQLLAEYYSSCRDRRATRLTAMLATFVHLISWIFLRLESPAWQQVKQHRQQWFPQVSSQHLNFFDALRYLLQSSWLLLIRQADSRQGDSLWLRFVTWVISINQRVNLWLNSLPTRFKETDLDSVVGGLQKINSTGRRFLLIAMGVIAGILVLICISQPFSMMAQFIFVVLLWGIAMVVRKVPGRFPALMLIVLSLTVSCRYMWWRYTATLNWHDPVSLICGLLLLAAETYAWVVLLLGYFQTIWPLQRKPAPLPVDDREWPTVDIMIPTYNEDLSVIKPTIFAALGIDWPKDKVNIYLLDDGKRPPLKVFAEEVGVHYIARPTNEYAKAGNINYALTQANGEYVAIFDCDHVPTRSFLQLTLGWFLKDPQLAVLQTPHHFFSPDPFERNLGRFRELPNEGTLFYGLVQDGNDMWDATFFCGSCAVLRRTALDEIGGIAVETVTEDAHTSLRMHRLGYTSAYIRIPLAAGLATESLSAHIGQRIRWARGMVQIFRLDNPLFGKGLKLSQRLCYANAMMHFLSGIPRLIFLTAPLAFLLLHAYIIFAPALAIVLFVVPHMMHASLTNSRIQGKYRQSFWSEIYETVLAWYIARPTTIALINPHKGKFNVTAKGGLIEEEHIDWNISVPYLVLVVMNILGLGFGVWRLYAGPQDEILTVIVSLVWVIYNMIILGGAVAVAVESKQIRKAHRIEIKMDAVIVLDNGYLYSCQLHDYSDGGVGIELREPNMSLHNGDRLGLILKRGEQEYQFPCSITRVNECAVGLRLDKLSTEQQIDFTQCTFARADTWSIWQDSFQQDKPIQSLADVMAMGFRGYQRMAELAPPFLRETLVIFTSIIGWLVSFMPRNIREIRPTE